MEKMILVSACLAGQYCRWDGGTNLVPEIKKLVDCNQAVLVCPETLGGLPTPRKPSERIQNRVINNAGDDGYLPAAEVENLLTSGATDDVYITELEKNAPQRIRMFIWLEGQDADCVASGAGATYFALNLELAGAN